MQTIIEIPTWLIYLLFYILWVLLMGQLFKRRKCK